MNKALTLITGLLILCTSLLNAQTSMQDPQAKKILDGLSAKLKTYKTITAEFTNTMEDKADPSMSDSFSGKLLVKGQFYNMTVMGQNIISDSKTIWTVIEDEEVQIDDAPTEEEEAENLFSPTKIFKFYEKGFKYKYDQEINIKGVICDQINLFPEESEDKSFHTIKLIVKRAEKQILSVIINGKDGMTYTYSISIIIPRICYFL